MENPMTTRKKKPAVTSEKPRSMIAIEGGSEQITNEEDFKQEAATCFPIVGIGASAGGLAAFEAFFSGMPAKKNPDMAFVLVQHLAPDHKSILTDLIRRYTRMQVFEVEDCVVVRPNCVYIIPPNQQQVFFYCTAARS